MLFRQDIVLDEALQNEAFTVSLLGEMTRYSLRVKAKDRVAFAKASGFKLPAKIGQSKLTKTQTILCLGPDEWMITCDSESKEKTRTVLEKMANKFTYSFTDVSHRNIGFIVSGAQAASLINIGCPLDMSLVAFPVGKVTRTVFENASIMLVRTAEQEFRIECWRSFGPYLCEFFDRFAADVKYESTEF